MRWDVDQLVDLAVIIFVTIGSVASAITAALKAWRAEHPSPPEDD